jgi:hypothetical protein
MFIKKLFNIFLSIKKCLLKFIKVKSFELKCWRHVLSGITLSKAKKMIGKKYRWITSLKMPIAVLDSYHGITYEPQGLSGGGSYRGWKNALSGT